MVPQVSVWLGLVNFCNISSIAVMWIHKRHLFPRYIKWQKVHHIKDYQHLNLGLLSLIYERWRWYIENMFSMIVIENVSYDNNHQLSSVTVDLFLFQSGNLTGIRLRRAAAIKLIEYKYSSALTWPGTWPTKYKYRLYCQASVSNHTCAWS